MEITPEHFEATLKHIREVTKDLPEPLPIVLNKKDFKTLLKYAKHTTAADILSDTPTRYAHLLSKDI